MDPKELRGLYEAYSEVYAPQEEIEEGYKEPRLDRKAFVKHANKRSGFSLGTREDPHGWREPGMEKVAKEFAARTASSRRAKRTGQPDTYRAEKEAQSKFKKEHFDIFDVVLEFLQAEGYAETLEEAEWLMANKIDEEAIGIILEITGGKGHPGYKAGSKDHGPMQSGHPADTRKRQVKGGTMSQRHGYHLGDIDDDDDDEDELETIVKQQSRDSRERVRKPLRNKVKAARKVLSKEEYVDEAIYSEKGKAKAAEMIAARSTPSGRAKSGKGANVAQIRQIRGSGRGSFDREGLGGTPMTPTMAKNPIKKRNYIGTGNKAARRAGTYQEQFELWVNSLVEEGYNLSGYTWDEMYEFYLDEAITSEKGKAKAAEMIAKRTHASGRAKSGQGANVATIKHIQRSNRDGLLGTPPNRKVAGSNWPKSYSGTGGTGNKAARRAAALKNEEYVDEAQEARNNPEKYEREQSKKSAPVRGERTPMPPRGDKRREDFEKWYAANVR